MLLYTGLVFYSASLYTATVNTVKDTVEDAVKDTVEDVVKDNDNKDSIEDSDEARVVRLHQQCEVLKQQVQTGGCISTYTYLHISTPVCLGGGRPVPARPAPVPGVGAAAAAAPGQCAGVAAAAARRVCPL